jgi:hypothetical protein
LHVRRGQRIANWKVPGTRDWNRMTVGTVFG